MPFLSLNGLAVPVSAGETPSFANVPIGEQFGSYSGMIISSIYSYRRHWRVRTTPMAYADAHSLAGLVAGKGQNWDFDDSLYSGKNSAAILTRDTTRFLIDGTSVSSGVAGYETGPNSAANSADKALWIETETTPLFGTDTFLDTDGGGGIASGYSAYSTGAGAGTRSMDAATTSFSRANSQKIVKNDGGADRFGIQSTLTSGVSQPNICKVLINVSALSAGANVILNADYYTAADAYLETQSTTISATTSGFETYELTATTNANAAKIRFYVWIQDNDGTIYVQIINSENKSYTTSYTNVARNAEMVTLDSTVFDRTDFTFGTWYKPIDDPSVSGRTAVLFYGLVDSDNYWKMLVDENGIPYFEINGRGSTVSTYSTDDAALTINTWAHLAVHGDADSFVMMVNGSETTLGAITTSLGYRVPTGILTGLYLGSDTGSDNHGNGIYSDTMLLPYNMATDQIAGYYGLSRPFYDLPKLELYGDYVKRGASNPIRVEGIFYDMKAVFIGGETKYILNFELIEYVAL